MLSGRSGIVTVATASLVLAACGSSDPVSTQVDDAVVANALDSGVVDPGEFGTAEMSGGAVGFDDGDQHFVVMTAGESRSPSEPAASDDIVDDVVADVGSGIAGENTVHFAHGARNVDVADGALIAVVAETDAERAAVATHVREGAVVAALVEDVAGALGTTGERYVYTEGGIFPSDDDAGVVADVLPASEVVAVAGDAAAAEVVDEPDLVIGFDDDDDILEAIGALDTTVEVELVGPGVIAVTTDGDGSDIEVIDGVESVTEEVLFSLSGDPVQPYQWHIENTGSPTQANGEAGTPGVDVRAELAWGAGSGSGIVVAVIDTGVKQNHPDFVGRIATNDDEVCGNGIDDDANGFVDDCTGWDFGSNDANTTPDPGPVSTGHGTHVAGIVAAGRNGVGVVGVAPDAHVMDLKVSDSAGQLRLSNVTAAIDYAVANGAEVINMSLGTNPGQVPRGAIAPLEAAVADAVAAGVVVVAAAGNNNVDVTNAAVWPAGLSQFYPGVVSVGASTNTDARAYFSNYGATVSVWAPGHQILSTGYGSEYEWKSGTSMAAPVVAGAAAVMLSADASFTPASVRTQMQNTGVAMSAGSRLDLARAVGVDPSTRVSVAYRNANALMSDTAGTVSIDVSAVNAETATQMRLSVATLDGSDVAAVSGLDAQIVAPTGAEIAVTTASDGSFAPVALGPDLATGVTFASTIALPAGDYAFVTELLTSDGAVIGGAQVAYITVREEGSEIISTTTVPQNPVTTSTVPAGDGGGGSAPTPTPPPVTTVPSGGDGGSVPVTTLAPVPVTTVPAGDGDGGGGGGGGDGGGSAPVPTPVTTVPSGGGGGSAPVTTVAPVPVTTVPSGDGDGGSGPAPSPVTTVPGGGGGSPTPTTAPSTTVPSNGGQTPPVTTTPAPDPDAQGDYSIVSMSPRSGRTTGFENVVIEGVFPDWVPVYVWFGDMGISQAHGNDGETLVVQTPSVSAAGVTDVIVKFTTSQSYELTFENAFTFYEESPGGGGTTPTTLPSPGGGSGPTTTTTVPSAGGGDGGGSVPTTTTTTTVPPGGGGGGGSSPATTTTTTTPPSSGAGPVWPRTRGGLTLNQPAEGSALALLFPAAWSGSGCQASSCAAASL